jgi:hypothetical protein
MTVVSNALASIDSFLAPIVPAGVTGTQFIAVFLIVYAVVYLLMSQVKILEKNKAAQLIFALIVAYFTASSTFSVVLVTKLFPNVGVVTMILISFLAVIAMVPGKKYRLTLGPLLTVAGILLIIFLTWRGVSGTLGIEGLEVPKLTRTEWYGIIFIFIFIGLIALIALVGGKRQPGGKFASFLKKFLGWEEGDL